MAATINVLGDESLAMLVMVARHLKVSTKS